MSSEPLAESPDTFFLVDYQLGKDQVTGVEVIKKLGISERSILVTSRYDDPEIHAVCSDLKIKLLPKQLLSYGILSRNENGHVNNLDPCACRR